MNGLQKPLEAYPKAGPEDLPSPPPVDPNGQPPEPKAKPEQVKPRIATLKFLDPHAMQVTVPLAFPFEWEGREIREITVRRLTTGEAGEIAAGIASASELDIYPFYAAMTNLPAEVVRGLEQSDGDKILDTCRPFLPRFLQEFLSGLSRDAGVAMPSQQPASSTSDTATSS